MTQNILTRAQAEDLLFEEAGLLDAWKLRDWLELLTQDASYLVPPLDMPDAEPGSALFLVTDDRVRLESRVGQLLGRSAWAESPRSRTRRLVSNVRVLHTDAGEARVTANFAVWRFSNQLSNVYVGRYLNALRFEKGRWRIRERRAILDLEALRPHGRLSFIL